MTTEALGHLAAEDWLHGVVPWWNPFSGVGMPLAGEMQNSALFLPFVLLLHFGRGVFLLKIAMQVVTGAAMFGLLRALGIRFLVCAIGAVLAEFNGTFAWYAHGPIMPVAFLPLLMFGIERCRIEVERAPKAWPALPVAIVAVAIAFSIYAGFPETAFLDGMFGAVFAVARVVSLRGAVARWLLSRALVVGAAVGALLAAPAAVPFLDFLRHAYLSVHEDLSASGLLPQSGAMLLFPYVFGPILANFTATGTGQVLWWHAGGYVGVVVAALAFAGMVGRRERSVRVAVTLWFAATFLRGVGVPPVVAAFDALPFLRHVLFPNYVEPSWEIGAVILAALAVEDWLAARRGRPVVGACLLVAVAALACAALRLGWPEIVRLIPRLHHYALLAGLPSLLSAGVCLLVVVLLSMRPTRRRFVVLGAAVCLDGVGNFAVPLFSAVAARPLDDGPVAYLRAHLGLGRFDSVGAIIPNYGAYYGIASVNHNYLPVPTDWVEFLHARLSPTMDGVEFFGDTLLPAGGGSGDVEQADRPGVSTLAAVGTLEGLGVRYVVSRHGSDPLTQSEGTAVRWRNPAPRALEPGQSMSFSFVPGAPLGGSEIVEAGVVVGTYLGRSNGMLTLTVCSGSVCRHGARDARQAADNALLGTALDGGLPVSDGPLEVTLSYAGGTSGIAIYEWPRADGDGRLPMFTVRARTPALVAPVVYSDGLVDIRALPDAAPYFATQGGRCRLQAGGRRAVEADCTGADRLIRRELFFPGWRARVEGRAVPVGRAGALFQSIALPPGRSSVRFAYAPPFARSSAAALLVGAGVLVAGLAWRRRRGAA